MWIIPKTLSAFVPATPGWSLESSERAWMFAQSVTWRSKFMSKQYWFKAMEEGRLCSAPIWSNVKSFDARPFSWSRGRNHRRLPMSAIFKRRKTKRTRRPKALMAKHRKLYSTLPTRMGLPRKRARIGYPWVA